MINTKCNVVEKSIIEKNGFLVDNSHEAPEISNLQIPDIMTVNQDLTAFHIIKTGQQINQG